MDDKPYEEDDIVQARSFIRSNYIRMQAGVPAIGGAPLIVEERMNRKVKKQLIDGPRKRRLENTYI